MAIKKEANMESIAQIKAKLAQCTHAQLSQFWEEYANDTRKGVQNLVLSAHKRYDTEEKELLRMQTMLQYERAAYEKGYHSIAGIDEVGRGPLAGPVVAAAVILPENHTILGVDDSKKLSAQKRESLAEQIKAEAIAWAVGIVSHTRIDEINILQATYEAMRQAISQLAIQPDYILADAVHIPQLAIPQEGIVKGDAKSMSIAAASIIAKVTRDAMMEELAEQYPEYDFASNKGYGSQKHIAGIAAHGLCPIHRRSFVKKIMEQIEQENTSQKGNLSEALAVRQMQKLGYTILAQNYRTAQGEIDIIAKQGDTLVFTEVKERSQAYFGTPAEAVDRRKQQKIIAAARQYLAENKMEDIACRFDVAEIKRENGQSYFRYLENAFWE